MAEGGRRSGRARQPNKKYTIDPFEGLEKALYASSDSGSSSTSVPTDEDSEEDVEFVVPEDARAEEEDDEELDDAVPSSGSDEEGVNEPDDDEIAFEDPESSLATNFDPNGDQAGRHNIQSQRVIMPQSHNLKAPKFQTLVERETHSRGVVEYRKRGSKEQRLVYMFGTTKEDVEPVLKTRDKWLWNPTLPSRTAGKDGIGGMGPSFYAPEEFKEIEIDQTRSWYFEQGGKDAFSSGQQSDLLTSTDAQKYMPGADHKDQSFLAGPLNGQKLYTLKTGESIRVSEPFEDERPGFILNLGNKILDLQWAPTVQGPTHYLAILVKQENPSIKKSQNHRSPSFAPQLPFSASIQIWAFKASDSGTIDSQTLPYLALVICTDWANVKQLKWCPTTLSDSVESDDGVTIQLGLLAAIWADGRLRVLDVKYPKPSSTASTTYLHVTRAAFESRPANTVCTCLTWVSPRTIAAGTALGTVAIWTLDSDTMSPSDPREDAVPWFYHPVHDSYILSIEAAYPSRPTHLSTISADGYLRMLDIRSPAMDTVTAPRQRVFCVPLCWHEHTQSFVAADENFYVRILPLRRFYMHQLVMRTSSFVTCAAVSNAHPILLGGSAGGEVTTGNPLRRALDAKCESWQQVWFGYEWRRPRQPTSNDSNSSSRDPSKSSDSIPAPNDVASQPLGRFVTGHEPTTQLLMPRTPHPATVAARAITYPHHDPATDGWRPPIIFEEQQAITALAWNPNVRVGGWAAAGLGSGLVRVEDLCVN